MYVCLSCVIRCSYNMAKRSFYRAANAILGKIGTRATEDVILQLIKSKCMPVLMYGLEVCPLRVSDENSLDFVVNRFFMELFKTNNNDTVDCCRMHFQFDVPSILAQRRTMNFVAKYRA